MDADESQDLHAVNKLGTRERPWCGSRPKASGLQSRKRVFQFESKDSKYLMSAEGRQAGRIFLLERGLSVSLVYSGLRRIR